MNQYLDTLKKKKHIYFRCSVIGNAINTEGNKKFSRKIHFLERKMCSFKESQMFIRRMCDFTFILISK